MSEGGRIRRGPQPQDNFTIVANSTVRDLDLSHRARGILVLLLSHAEGFEVRLEDLQTERERLAAVRSAVHELEAAGYLVRRRARRENGQLGAADWDLRTPPACDNRT